MPSTRPLRRAPLLGLAVLALSLAVTGCADDAPDDATTSTATERQQEVAERGAGVMPFDLDTTTHVFDPTDEGGVQDVVADDPGDAEQIALIREHLREERDRFAVGDFGDPASIHGHDMAGLEELRSGYGDVTITYEELPAGARLTYTTDDADLVDAIHAWFDQQLMDHGAHAEHG